MVNRQERLDDDEEATHQAINGRMANVWTSFPATVNSVDLGNNTVSVTPTIQINVKDANGNITPTTISNIPNVPIVWPKAGGYSLTFPIKAGDECLVSVASRAIDGWHQSGNISKQIESRMHDLTDSFAIFGVASAPNAVGAVSTDSVQLRNDSGQTFVEINDSGDIKLSSPTKITLDTPIVYVTGQIENIAGAHSGGNYDATFLGNIHASDDVTAQGTSISLTNHVHTGVEPGGGDTGPPVG